MSEPKRNTGLKVFKVVFISLIVLVGVQLFVRYMLTTDMVHRFVQEKITSAANEQLNGELKIGEVSGDLWKEILLTDVTVSDTEELIHADTVYVQYQIWSFLSSVYKINQFRTTGVDLKISEDSDTSFNITRLLKETEPEPATEATQMQFIVSDIRLTDINAHILSSSYLPDGELKIEQLNARASLSSVADSLNASLDQLDFILTEGRLPEPVKIGASADYRNQNVSLQQLVIETGRSVLNASAALDIADSTLNARVNTMPFSLRDLKPYLNESVPSDDLNIRLSVSGKLSDMKLKLELDHNFAPEFEMVAGLDLSGEPMLTQFGMLGRGINIAHFTNDSIDAEVGDFRLSLSGTLKKDMANSDVIWGFTFNKIRYKDYLLSRIIASGTLQDDDLTGHLGINPQGEEQLNAYPTITNLTGELPEWKVGIDIHNLDLNHWAGSGSLNSDLDLKGLISGKGFRLSDEPWQYRLGTDPIRPSDLRTVTTQTLGVIESIGFQRNKDPYSIGSQKFRSANIEGDISKTDLHAVFSAVLDSSRVEAKATFNDFLSETPSYNYEINTRTFNAAEISSLEDFPTSMNLKITGEGTGLDPEECEISGMLTVDSSMVNGARFQLLEGQVTFRNGILNVREGNLESDIIDGAFTGRKNVLDETDPENWLSLDLIIKNIQPLAPLANVNNLNATGSVAGRISQDTSGTLKGDLNLDLEDIHVDTLFTANRIFGGVKAEIADRQLFDLNLDIQSPVFRGLTFQDIQLRSAGSEYADTLKADFELYLVGSDRGRLIQKGEFIHHMESGLTDIRFDTFDLITSESRLDLQKPFRVRVQENSIGTDTLLIKSVSDNTYLNFAIPYADSVEQHAWVDGKDFDFGIMQDVIFGERYLDGILSGNIKIDRVGETVTGAGSFDLTRISYQNIEADSLALRFNLAEERLAGSASVFWDGQEYVSGNVDVPFVLFEEELDEEFYEQPVRGQIAIKQANLERFKSILDAYGYAETRGILGVNGRMSGTAGEPSFRGDIMLTQPVLSGISLDTVTAGFRYDHLEGGLEVNAEVSAARQKAAEIHADIPLSYDFRKFEMNLPGESDTITVSVETRDFNLAVFNDFLDKEYMRGLQGTLNADFVLQGTADNMIPAGYFIVSGGRVNVPVAGITLERIRSDVDFTSQGLRINDLSMVSGRGDFKASGSVTLEGIMPQQLNIKARANQFRLANTADYNMVVDLESTITGQASTPQASGKFTVRNGFVYLDDFGEKSVEEVYLEGEEASSFSAYDSLALDMVVEIQRNFYIRNRDYLDMEIEMTGTLDAQKETNGELMLFGSMEGRQGYVQPLGKVFTMEESNFTFSGPIDNPDIFVRSKHVPPTRQKGESVVLYYIIEGTAQDPTFRFDSDPLMEEQDIVCYTLFGKPCYSLESWQSVFADGDSPTATDILTDVLLDEVEALATRELGVDVVQIDNTGTSGGTSIKTGWYINDRTFFAIVNEITKSRPKTMFILEYLISEKVDLILTQGDSNESGIDIRFQHDY